MSSLSNYRANSPALGAFRLQTTAKLHKLIDLHIHLLAGIDDGPATLDGSVALAKRCVAEGVTEVAVTPHVSEAFPNTSSSIQSALSDLRQRLAEESISLGLAGGAEIAIDRLPSISDDELISLSYAGAGKYALLEFPYAAWPLELDRQIGRLADLGMRAVFAHPERSAGVQEQGGVDRVASAVARGSLVQVTAGSLAGRFGRTAKATAEALLDRDAVHLVASDAHNTDRRPPRMIDATARMTEDRKRWLTDDVPRAILDGAAIPTMPDRPSPKRRWFRRV